MDVFEEFVHAGAVVDPFKRHGVIIAAAEMPAVEEALVFGTEIQCVDAESVDAFF